MVARRTGEGNRETPLCPVRNGGLSVPVAACDHIDPRLDQAAWRAPLAEPAPAGLRGGGRGLHSLCDAGEGQSGCPQNISADPGDAARRALPAPAAETIGAGCGQSTRSGSAEEYDKERDSDQRQRYSRSEEHTSELQSLMRISYAHFCLK